MRKFYVKNIELEDEKYEINEYIVLRKNSKKPKETIIEINDTDNLFENNIILFYRALEFSIPTIHIDAYSEESDTVTFSIIKSLSSIMINYYSLNDKEVIDTRNVKIGTDSISNLISIFKLIIEYNKEQSQKRKEGKDVSTRWSYAYNQYINACTNISIENSILNIITGLESLLVKGSGDLTYKVSLYSSIIASDIMEERKQIRDLIKWMYNIRSKVVHGEIAEVVKKLSDSKLYDKYYKLKELFSEIMIKTYKIDEKILFEKLEDMIFGCPSFTINR